MTLTVIAVSLAVIAAVLLAVAVSHVATAVRNACAVSEKAILEASKARTDTRTFQDTTDLHAARLAQLEEQLRALEVDVSALYEHSPLRRGRQIL